MSDKPEKAIANNEMDILKNNPKISKSVVEQYCELEKKLKQLGVDTEPHYTLSPPLGNTISRLFQEIG